MSKLRRLSEIQDIVKTTFGFSDVIATLSKKEENLCQIEVSFDDSDYKVTEVYLTSPDNEITYLVKLALFNNMWNEEYTISPHTKIVKTIIDEFNLDSYGYHIIRNTLYEEPEDDIILDEVTGTSRLENLSVTFSDAGDVETLILTTSEGNFILGEDGARYKPSGTCCKCK